MVDKKVNFTLFILVVNQIHNLYKQLRLYIFQAPFDSLYKLCKTFNFFFLFFVLQSFEEFSQHIPLSDVLTLISNHFKYISEL